MHETPDPRGSFLAQVAQIADDLGLFEDVIRDPDRFAIILRRDDALHSCSLENLHLAALELSPEERTAQIRRWLDAMTRRHDRPETWEQARPLLRPVIRTPSFLATRQLEPHRDQFVQVPVTPMLRFALSLDLGESMAWLRSQDLSAWGVSEELARHAALENLAEHAGDGIEPYDPTAASPIWHVNTGDGYEPSRLLLPGWLAAFVDRVDGPPIAAIPHRGALLVTGGASPQSIDRIARIARDEYEASPGPLSPALYTVSPDGEGFEPLVLPADHPSHAVVDEATVWLRATEYEEQRAVLDTLGTRQGELTAAPIEMGRTRGPHGESYLTVARWRRGEPRLLPEVDLVLLDDGGQERQVEWEVLRSEWPGSLEQIERADPPRWRTTRWPEH